MAVESILVPRITYLSNAWGGSGKSNITALQKVQNQAARVIYNLGKFSRAPVSPYIADLGWMRVAETVKYRDIVMVKCLLQGTAALEMVPLKLPTHSDGLRQLSGGGFNLPDGSQKKFGYRAVKAYDRHDLAPKPESSLFATVSAYMRRPIVYHNSVDLKTCKVYTVEHKNLKMYINVFVYL